MARTSIEWTDHSVNPIRFGPGHYCQKITPGCTNCYASRLQPRFGTPEFGGAGRPAPHATSERRDGALWLDESKLCEVLRRKKPTRYFWCDMTDLFGDWVPDEWIDRCFATMALTPQHTHQVLTKRPERMAAYLGRHDVGLRWALSSEDPPAARTPEEAVQWTRNGPPNVWLGVSVDDQQRADERIPHLLRTPAAVRFLSCEPLLGPVDVSPYLIPRHLAELDSDFPDYEGDGDPDRRVRWVIVGGESGPGARPCRPEWIRSLLGQCRAAGVPAFCNQLGGNVVTRNDMIADDFNDGESGWPDPDVKYDIHGFREDYQGADCRVRLRDKKGGDVREWPADLRVREFPTTKEQP